MESIPAASALPSGRRLAVIGDVHGNASALESILSRISKEPYDYHYVFVGDIAHKGADSVGTYRTVLDMIDEGTASMVASNHGEADLRRIGAALSRYHNIAEAAEALYMQASALPKHATLHHVAKLAGDLAGVKDGDELAERIVAAQRAAPLQLLADDLLVVHGGVTPSTFGSGSRRAKQICLYGLPTGVDSSGKPQGRDSWVDIWCQARDEDPSLPAVAYGHITYPEPRVTRSTFGLDTGCGDASEDARLSALLWHGSAEEYEIVSVKA